MGYTLVLRRQFGALFFARPLNGSSTWNTRTCPSEGKGVPSMSKVQKPRLGRGLRSLIPGGHLPVEVELPPPAAESGSIATRTLEAPTDVPPPSSPATPSDRGVGRVSDAQAGVGQPLMISPDKVHPNPHQPRQSLDEAKVAELAASIKSTGMIQPIVV